MTDPEISPPAVGQRTLPRGWCHPRSHSALTENAPQACDAQPATNGRIELGAPHD